MARPFDRSPLTRRAALAGFAASSALIASPALAQRFAANTAGDAEWDDSFDTGSRASNVQGTYPTLSASTAQSIEGAIAQYRDIVARGGWPKVPTDEILRIGKQRPAVANLRTRLIATGDLDASAGRSDVFDSYVDAGVKRFQARHGYNIDGIVSDGTLAALNVSAEARLRQLETNLVRVRSMSGFLGNRQIVMNIPAAQLEAIENGVVASRHITIVGKIDRQSPIISTHVQNINFNPYWTVPASIIKKDLIPKMQKEPNYLTDNKIHIHNPRTGQEVMPSAVNWFSDEGTRYMYRQDSGAENSMGHVRINIPNQHAVYMHDTPNKTLFGEEARFHSSGCTRVQGVRDLCAWILEGTQWSRAEIDRVFKSGDRVDGTPNRPVNVYWVYVTAWANPEGVVQFRDDIYQRDGLGQQANNAARRL